MNKNLLLVLLLSSLFLKAMQEEKYENKRENKKEEQPEFICNPGYDKTRQANILLRLISSLEMQLLNRRIQKAKIYDLLHQLKQKKEKLDIDLNNKITAHKELINALKQDAEFRKCNTQIEVIKFKKRKILNAKRIGEYAKFCSQCLDELELSERHFANEYTEIMTKYKFQIGQDLFFEGISWKNQINNVQHKIDQIPAEARKYKSQLNNVITFIGRLEDKIIKLKAKYIELPDF